MQTIPVAIHVLVFFQTTVKKLPAIRREPRRRLVIVGGIGDVATPGAIGPHDEQIPVALFGAGPEHNPAEIVDLGGQLGGPGIASGIRSGVGAAAGPAAPGCQHGSRHKQQAFNER